MKRIVKFAFAIGISSALYGQSTTNAPIYKISTVAGQETFGDFDPNAPGTGRAAGAVLIQPDAVVFDFAGNMFIADSAANLVRKVDTAGNITTVAGNGNPGYDAISEGRPASQARLSGPSGLAFDPAGNLYIVDQGNHRIRKIDANGIINTVAGVFPIFPSTGAQIPNATTGGTTNGYDGDNRPAKLAHLNSPRGIAFDPAGNMYIADTSNNRIRKVDINGIITTVAGNGIPGWAGDGGLAITARLNAPEGIFADVNSNLFIGDTGNHRVRLVTANGIISTIAGTCLPLFTRNAATGQNVPTPCTTGTAGFASTTNFAGVTGGDLSPATSSTLNSPRAIALDLNGNLLIADAGNNRVRTVSTNGIITTLAGGGTLTGENVQAIRASLNNPRFVTLDPIGRIVYADSSNGKIRAIDPNTGIVQTLAGQAAFSGDNGPATSARLNNPRGVAVDGAGNIYVSDTGNNRVRKVTNGIITTFAGNGVSGFAGDISPNLLIAPATSANLNQPSCLAVTPNGLLYFADRNNNRIRRIDLDGTISTVAGRSRTTAESTTNPNSAIPAAPTFSGDGAPATLAQLNAPNCVAADPNTGNLVIADTGNNAIRQVNVSTGIITTVGGNSQIFNSLCFTTPVPIGQPILVGNTLANSTSTTVPGGLCSGYSGDGSPAIFAQFNGPQGIAVDPSSNIFIADTGNHTVREILAANGIIQAVSGVSTSSGSDGDDASTLTGAFNSRIDPPFIGSRLSSPQGVATDNVGNIYIADTGNNRIRRINAAQTYIQSIAGAGVTGPTITVPGGTTTVTTWFPPMEGDFGNRFVTLQPSAIATDGAGNVYFTDRVGTIRKLTPNVPPAQQGNPVVQ